MRGSQTWPSWLTPVCRRVRRHAPRLGRSCARRSWTMIPFSRSSTTSTSGTPATPVPAFLFPKGSNCSTTSHACQRLLPHGLVIYRSSNGFRMRARLSRIHLSHPLPPLHLFPVFYPLGEIAPVLPPKSLLRTKSGARRVHQSDGCRGDPYVNPCRRRNRHGDHLSRPGNEILDSCLQLAPLPGSLVRTLLHVLVEAINGR